MDVNIVVEESDKHREYFNKERSNGDRELVNDRKGAETRATGGAFDGNK